jgi:transposase
MDVLLRSFIPAICAASASTIRSPEKPWSFSPINSHCRPHTICALYKSRWQVELFFKWIKQHLRIKAFYGTRENAVKTQIWIAVSVYLLVAIIKKRLNLTGSLYTLLQVLSVTLFEKIPIQQALQQKDYTNPQLTDPNQLILFDF